MTDVFKLLFLNNQQSSPLLYASCLAVLFSMTIKGQTATRTDACQLEPMVSRIERDIQCKQTIIYL